MKFQQFSFGQIRIDGVEYSYDIVIDRGEVSKRKKKASKRFREAFGHTPLSLEEGIPWKCRRLAGKALCGRLHVRCIVRPSLPLTLRRIGTANSCDRTTNTTTSVIEWS
jgi:hypothetical protein